MHSKIGPLLRAVARDLRQAADKDANLGLVESAAERRALATDLENIAAEHEQPAGEPSEGEPRPGTLRSHLTQQALSAPLPPPVPPPLDPLRAGLNPAPLDRPAGESPWP